MDKFIKNLARNRKKHTFTLLCYVYVFYNKRTALNTISVLVVNKHIT